MSELAWAGGVDLREGNYRALIIRAAGRQERLAMIARARGYQDGWIRHQMEAYRAKSGPIWRPLWHTRQRW